MQLSLPLTSTARPCGGTYCKALTTLLEALGPEPAAYLPNKGVPQLGCCLGFSVFIYPKVSQKLWPAGSEAVMAGFEASIGEPAVEKRSLKALTLQSLKRTYDMFAGNYSVKAPVDERR